MKQYKQICIKNSDKLPAGITVILMRITVIINR